jgi:SulP family sulfate permease
MASLRSPPWRRRVNSCSNRSDLKAKYNPMPNGAATAHLYEPKLAAVLREGYNLDMLRRDAVAGLTVAIVALPLSMAIAVASGVSPDHGLYTAIVGGFVVSLLGGSRYQIGGPAGAFITLVAATTAEIGLDGLALTVLVSGALLTLIGLLGLGRFIRLIPHPVTVGFTGGIAVTIAASQIKDLFGLTLAHEPGPMLPKLQALAAAATTFSLASLALGAGCATIIFGVRRLKPNWPGMLIAVVAASVAAWGLGLPVDTIGTRFGGIPHGLPAPHMPAFSLALLWSVLPAAFSFTLLGGIESLLSAKVADGMTGRAHRSNMELVAQGLANVASAFFGGIAVTGTIARTATNVRAGARTPVSGLLHSVFLLVFMLVAGSLASYVPLAALAGVLIVVCWNMAEKAEFAALLRRPGPGAVLLTTFGLTILRDLTTGIIGGCIVAAAWWLVSRRKA